MILKKNAPSITFRYDGYEWYFVSKFNADDLSVDNVPSDKMFALRVGEKFFLKGRRREIVVAGYYATYKFDTETWEYSYELLDANVHHILRSESIDVVEENYSRGRVC